MSVASNNVCSLKSKTARPINNADESANVKSKCEFIPYVCRNQSTVLSTFSILKRLSAEYLEFNLSGIVIPKQSFP